MTVRGMELGDSLHESSSPVGRIDLNCAEPGELDLGWAFVFNDLSCYLCFGIEHVLNETAVTSKESYTSIA